MDKEQQAAQALTRDDLIAKFRDGRKADLARPKRPRDLNRMASVLVTEATEANESGFVSIMIGPDDGFVFAGNKVGSIDARQVSNSIIG